MGLRLVPNEEVVEVTVEVPAGHRHLRATLRLADGSAWVLHEATLANLLRAFVTVKTHPVRTRVRLVGRQVPGRKPGYAQWQLLEQDEGP